ncbi:hypothetical protein [Cytobacillus firmus]|uniref:Uncharacterized protein n=1 Tax=Cytobacillus firmus TaxID=1399 RepID=A0AA46SGV9_CYTFI|nr:hypothetical protein [Cytobacillus firmus]UYG98198.1 hypothetical protein OD459_25345 [Cytobacillus firmus]
MRMTKDAAKSRSKKGIENSKKYGIPLKKKKMLSRIIINNVQANLVF